jgi:hypothetical protein
MANGFARTPNTCRYMYLGGEESARERDLDIVPTYTTCNARKHISALAILDQEKVCMVKA